MTIIKGSTKRGQQLLANHRTNLGDDLFDVYGTVSKAKHNAMKDCEYWRDRTQGRNFRITGKNCHQFTVAWEYEMEYEDPETGEVTLETVTRIHTKDNVYIVLHNKQEVWYGYHKGLFNQFD